MKISFTEFFFAYLLEECRKKVATIIFIYLTSEDEIECLAVLFSSSFNPGLTHVTVKTFHNCGKADCTGSGQSKSRLKNLDLGRIRTLYS